MLQLLILLIFFNETAARDNTYRIYNGEDRRDRTKNSPFWSTMENTLQSKMMERWVDTHIYYHMTPNGKEAFYFESLCSYVKCPIR